MNTRAKKVYDLRHSPLGQNKGTVGQRERFKDNRQDVYREQKKWPEPTRCPVCSAVFMKGRWIWDPNPYPVHETLCPACRRMADRVPAGHISIKGAFFEEHREEMLNLVRNLEEAENKNRPMERIMTIDDEADGTIITTTGIHLAKRIGDAFLSAYEGHLELKFGEGEQSVRVLWRRE